MKSNVQCITYSLLTLLLLAAGPARAALDSASISRLQALEAQPELAGTLIYRGTTYALAEPDGQPLFRYERRVVIGPTGLTAAHLTREHRAALVQQLHGRIDALPGAGVRSGDVLSLLYPTSFEFYRRYGYSIARAPVIGDLVSMSFNGDSYPCGTIAKISKSLRRVETNEGKVFYRKQETGRWLQGGWALINGHIREQNPHF